MEILSSTRRTVVPYLEDLVLDLAFPPDTSSCLAALTRSAGPFTEPWKAGVHPDQRGGGTIDIVLAYLRNFGILQCTPPCRGAVNIGPKS